MQCTAKSKRSGVQCKRSAVIGGTKCHMHGGASLGGIASPTFRHGRYSKRLPERLAARYAEAQNDPRLLELRDEVALVDVRLGELLGNLDTGESGRAWKALRTAHSDLQAATLSNDTGAFRVAMAALGRLVESGGDDYAVWQEIGELVEQRRKLSESERKYQIAAQMMITSERAMVLLGAVVDIIRRNVDDRHVLAVISNEIRMLTQVEHDA